MFDRGVLDIVVAAGIVDRYCLMFYIGVGHIVVAVILLTIIVSGLTDGVVHIVVAAYIVDHYF